MGNKTVPWLISILALSGGLHVACGSDEAEPTTASSTTTGGMGGQGGEGGSVPTQDCEALAVAAQAALDASLVAEQMADPARVGGTVAAVISRDCEWAGATGTANNPGLAEPILLEPNALIPYSSATKSYTATAVMLAVEDGLLTLDDTLSMHVITGIQNEDTITIRQLLNHTSGVANYYEDDDFLLQTLNNPQDPVTPQEVVDVAIGLGPSFAPGTDWGYSNTNYTLLGMVLEEVFAQDLATIYRQRLLEPHGLERTFFLTTEMLPETVTPGFYGTTNATGIPHPTVSGAAGAMAGDVTDLTRWMRLLVTGDVVSASSTAEMQTWHELFPGFGIGFGLFTFPDDVVGVAIGHDGARPGYETEVFHLPEHDVTVGILTNNRESLDLEAWEAVARAAVPTLVIE